MGLIDAAISTKTAKSAGIVTIWITLKPFGIRTYERGFKSMKTFDFNPCISHTYEKHRGEGVAWCWHLDGLDRKGPQAVPK